MTGHNNRKQDYPNRQFLPVNAGKGNPKAASLIVKRAIDSNDVFTNYDLQSYYDYFIRF
jgi:hypothetical protein